MIDVFDSNVDGDKVKVFVSIKDGTVTSYTVGNHAVSKGGGIQFYVDEYISNQLDKLEITIDGFDVSLKVCEGETIVEPKLTEKEKEIKRLEDELERLRQSNEEEMPEEPKEPDTSEKIPEEKEENVDAE